MKVWPAGSLEEKVQNLVKTWEMELFHKVNIEDFKTLDANKYTFSLNGNTYIYYFRDQFSKYIQSSSLLRTENEYVFREERDKLGRDRQTRRRI